MRTRSVRVCIMRAMHIIFMIGGIGGGALNEALTTLAVGGSLTTLGYAAQRESTIDVTNLIWKRASIKSFSIFAQPQALWDEAWKRS